MIGLSIVKVVMMGVIVGVGECLGAEMFILGNVIDILDKERIIFGLTTIHAVRIIPTINPMRVASSASLFIKGMNVQRQGQINYHTLTICRLTFNTGVAKHK
jgi:hypothetical protein